MSSLEDFVQTEIESFDNELENLRKKEKEIVRRSVESLSPSVKKLYEFSERLVDLDPKLEDLFHLLGQADEFIKQYSSGAELNITQRETVQEETESPKDQKVRELASQILHPAEDYIDFEALDENIQKESDKQIEETLDESIEQKLSPFNEKYSNLEEKVVNKVFKRSNFVPEIQDKILNAANYILKNNGADEEGSAHPKELIFYSEFKEALKIARSHNLNPDIEAYHFKNILGFREDPELVYNAFKKALELFTEQKGIKDNKYFLKQRLPRGFKKIKENIDEKEHTIYLLKTLNAVYDTVDIVQFIVNNNFAEYKSIKYPFQNLIKGFIQKDIKTEVKALLKKNILKSPRFSDGKTPEYEHARLVLNEAYKLGLDRNIDLSHFKSIKHLVTDKKSVIKTLKKSLDILIQEKGWETYTEAKSKFIQSDFWDIKQKIGKKEYKIHLAESIVKKYTTNELKSFIDDIIELEKKKQDITIEEALEIKETSSKESKELILNFYNHHMNLNNGGRSIIAFGDDTPELNLMRYLGKHSILDVVDTHLVEPHFESFTTKAESAKKYWPLEEPRLLNTPLSELVENDSLNNIEKFNLINLHFGKDNFRK